MTHVSTVSPPCDRKLRVLFCESGHRGGSVAQLYQLIRRLDHCRLDMGFVSFHNDSMAARLFTLPDLFCKRRIAITPSAAPDTMKPLGSHWIPTPFALYYCVVAAQLIFRYRPHVIYLNNSPRNHLPMLWIAARSRLPVICHLREATRLSGIDRLGIPSVSAFVALSHSLAQHYIAEGINASLINVAYDTFILAEFDRESLQPPASCLPSGPVYAVQVGTLNDNKRPMLAVEGLAIAKKNCPALKLVLIGEGPARTHVEEVVRNHNLQSDVILLGQRSDVPSLLTQCHIGMLLSRREGFGDAVLEYMAARLPAIVSRTSSTHEIVIPNTTAFVLKDPTPPQVAYILSHLYHDPDLRLRMGQAGRQRLERSPSVTEGATSTVQSLIERIGGQ